MNIVPASTTGPLNTHDSFRAAARKPSPLHLAVSTSNSRLLAAAVAERNSYNVARVIRQHVFSDTHVG